MTQPSEEALDSYSKALVINPDEHESWFGQGKALSYLGNHQYAIDSYDPELQ